jgi:DNA mismatch repair protein MutS
MKRVYRKKKQVADELQDAKIDFKEEDYNASLSLSTGNNESTKSDSTEKSSTEKSSTEKLNMTDEYFMYVEKYQKIYGINTVVLLQNGSFFEMYGIDNAKEKVFSEIRQVCDVLDIYVSRKNKSILENGRNNPLMAGFPTWAYQKHIQNLLDYEYTVVIFQQREIQKGVFERFMSEVLSPSIQLEYTSKNMDGVHCISFYMKQGVEYFSKVEFWTVSASVIDISTGKIYLYEITHSRLEKKESVFFDMIRLCKTHTPHEIIMNIEGDSFEKSETFWRKQLGYLNTLHMIIVNENGLSKIFENNVTIDKIRKLKYQLEFFNKVYSHISTHCSIDKISFCNLEKNEYMRICLIILLQFVYNHNKSLLEKIYKPEWCECLGEEIPKFLKIENNSMEQIGLFSEGNRKKYTRSKTKFSCVFDILNETKTAVGYRFLKENLSKPLINIEEIKMRQRHIQMMKNTERENENNLECTRDNLCKINDLERIHRKVQLNMKGFSLCFEFSQLENSYSIILKEILKWSQIFSSDSLDEINNLQSALDFIRRKLNIENCTNTPRNQSIELQIFNGGQCEILDKLFTKKQLILNQLEIERMSLEKIIIECEAKTTNTKSASGGGRKKKQEAGTLAPEESKSQKTTITTKQIMLQKLANESSNVSGNSLGDDLGTSTEKIYASSKFNIVKLECNEKEKFYFSISNSKSKVLQTYLTKNPDKQIRIKSQVSNSKITNAIIDNLNMEYTECLEAIDRISKEKFYEFVSEFNRIYGEYFTKFNYFVGYLDFIQSGAFISRENNYICPEIVNNEFSFIECKELRHPLVEKILIYSTYIPNDICIGKEKNGYLIFGTNSCGKSVFMKSVGIAIIMAQIGYDVACRSMKFSPFHNIITRMSGNDDQLKGQSSFAVEMIELNLILSRSTKNSLILGDEICHGTEQISGISLVASALIHLCNGRVPFVFASHLHQLSKMDCVLDLDGLAMKHLTVKRQRTESESTLVYERKLRDGSGDATYGIEVAKYIIENQEFIYLAEKIQKVVQDKELNIVSEKISRYNRMLFVDDCQVCGSRAQETHHIIQQKDADEKKMVVFSEDGLKKSMNHFTNLVALCENCHLAIHGKKGKRLQIYGYQETASGLELKYEWKI